MFDIGITEFMVLGIAALFIFGPDRLPGIARQAGRGLRQLRDLAMNARRDLSRELGPEFEDFDLRDLNPKQFVRKHVLDDVDEDDLRLDADLDVRKDLRVDLDEDRASRSSRTNGTTKRHTTKPNGTDTSNGTDAKSTTNGADPATADAEPADPTSETEPVGESASVPAGGSAEPAPPKFDPDAT